MKPPFSRLWAKGCGELVHGFSLATWDGAGDVSGYLKTGENANKEKRGAEVLPSAPLIPP